jgi:uncharacterized delta-60 repeat protein
MRQVLRRALGLPLSGGVPLQDTRVDHREGVHRGTGRTWKPSGALRPGRVRLMMVLGLMLTFAQPPSGAAAASGDLDQTFGRGGKVTTDLGLYPNGASDLAIQTDGKIVAAGEMVREDVDPRSVQDFALVRYHPDGTVDAGFGNNGVVTTDFGGMEYAPAIAIQTDGKIVVAGTVNSPCPCVGVAFALARYNSNGTLDTQFAGTGKVTTLVDGDSSARGVVIAPDGKIVAVGTTGNGDFALVRYQPGGTVDAGFGNGGKVITDFGIGGSRAEDIVIQDGKIVVAGSVSTFGTSYLDRPSLNFAVARYHSNGSLDTAFGVLGKVVTDFDGDDSGNSVAIQGDKIVVGGWSLQPGQERTESDFALARYNADGTLDDGLLNGGGFGTGGKVITDLGSTDELTGLVIQADRKIVAAGGSGEDFALTRYEPDGSVDGGFGTGGRVTTDFAGGEDFASGVVIQAGKIVLAGTSDGSFALARYLSDDGLDTVAPETTIMSGPPATTTDDTPTFEFTSTEAGSSFECRVDSLAFTPCTSPYTTQSLASGSHAFEVRATDPAGNIDATPATQSFTVEAPVELPALSIADTSAKEGNGGNKNIGFTVTLSRSSSDSVTVDWATANGSAATPEDYTGATGSLTFAAGELSKVVTVLVNGDRTRESNETFSVNLTSPTNATIADNQATGTIVNDD